MAPKDKEEKAIPVTVDSGKNKDGDKKVKKDDVDENENMSEEDRDLKERLETCVSTVLNEENETSVTVPIRNNALDVIVNELRTATASMTSVPKPLKFLRPHFAKMKSLYYTMDGD
jgi:26S proteasome regulatory subunit N1